MLVSTIVNDVAGELGDASMITWTRPELIGFLNQAVTQTVLVRPDANIITEPFVLAADTKQALPADASRLHEVVRNMGADGATPGKVVKYIDSDDLDAFNPDWHSDTPAAIIASYLYDESSPDVFYVHPPADGTTQIEIKVSKVPTALDPDMNDTVFNDAGTVVGLKDIYSNTLMEWMLYKAFSVEKASAFSPVAAQTHMQSFYNSLGVKLKADVLNSPRRNNAYRTETVST